jgi:hypothetical protein
MLDMYGRYALAAGAIVPHAASVLVLRSGVMLVIHGRIDIETGRTGASQ